MFAMVLAAGRGERMKPLTLSVPKPVIPVLGRPMIEQILMRLARGGYTDIAVNLHHLPCEVEDILAGGEALGLNDIYYSREEILLGTAGGVLGARDFFRGAGTILVRNSDFLSDINLEEAAAAHLLSGCPVTLVLAPARAGYTEVLTDRNDRVLSLGTEPPCDPDQVSGRYLFTGLQFIEEEILDRLPSDRPSDLVRDLYRDLAAEGALACHVHDGFWWEFGDPAAYLQGSLELLSLEKSRLREITDTDTIRTIGTARVAVGMGSESLPGVTFRGRAALGMAVVVSEGTTIEDTVVMPESWIGPECNLRRCLVGPESEIPSGTDLVDKFICRATAHVAKLPPGTERFCSLLIRDLD